MKRYANAKKVLPKNLLEKVQKHHTGILWVPAPGRFFKERRQLVIALRLQGVASKEIATLAGITSRRVNQILAAHRKVIESGYEKAVPVESSIGRPQLGDKGQNPLSAPVFNMP